MNVNIFRCKIGGREYDPEINVFHGRESIDHTEVRIEENGNGVKGNKVAYPAKEGHYANGGCFICTSNSVVDGFTKPIPLHDRDMSKET